MLIKSDFEDLKYPFLRRSSIRRIANRIETTAYSVNRNVSIPSGLRLSLRRSHDKCLPALIPKRIQRAQLIFGELMNAAL